MGEVVPFGRPAKPTPEPASSRGRELAAEQNRAARQAHQRAARAQADERLIAAGAVVPARISLAMNLGGHEGPAVDIACGTREGNLEGDVDSWELGETVPSEEQVEKMAAFAGMPKVWFYRPMTPGPLLGRDGEPGFIWMCGPSGCTAVASDWVDERGVLHYGDEGQRESRKAVQGTLPVDVEPAESTPRRAVPGKKTATPAAPQPQLPASSRMPEHLRAALRARLDARKNR